MTEVTITERSVSVTETDTQVDVSVDTKPVSVGVTTTPVTITETQLVVTVAETETQVDVTVTATPVTINLTTSQIDITVTDLQVLVTEDVRQVDITVTENPVTVDVGLCVQAVAGPVFLQAFITDDPLSTGHLVAINSAGHVELAEADGLFQSIGASSAAYPFGAAALINAYQGRLTPILFDSVPLLADNGKPVYLSATPGIASLTKPAMGTVLQVGILATADGVTITPSVVWSPLFPPNTPQVDEFFPVSVLSTSSYLLTEIPILATLTVFMNGKRLARGVGSDYTLVGKTVFLDRKVKPGYIVAAEYEHI